MHESSKPGFCRRMTTASALAVAAVLVTACASAPAPPTASLAAARSAIASAEQADARQYAGAELDQAGHKLEQAEDAVTAARMTEAERLAHQSRVTAELAAARAEAAKAAEINRQMSRGAEALTEEMERRGEQQ